MRRLSQAVRERRAAYGGRMPGACQVQRVPPEKTILRNDGTKRETVVLHYTETSGRSAMDRCVLVVEDEPLIRMDTVSMLEEAGLTVVDFDSADGAVAFLRAHADEIAAIFTDVNLRGQLSGIDLADIVKDTSPNIKVVVTSGRFDTRPLQLSADVEFLKKPWLPLQVLNAMQTAVGL